MVDRRWSAGEMVALIEAWRPLYNRRRGGESDAWVPASWRTRARRTGALVYEDWRAVATAVNGFRTEINLEPIRTHQQCKMRVKRLKRQFGDEQLATPSWLGFSPLPNDNTSGGRGHSSLRGPATAAMETHGDDECGRGAAGGQARGGSAVAAGGSAAAEVKGVPVGAGAATVNESDGVAVEVDVGTPTAPKDPLACGTSEDQPSGPVGRFTAAAETDFLGGPIPKKRRTGASTSADAGDGRAPSVEKELDREGNARRARVDEGRAPAGGFATTAAEMVAALGEVVAAESNDVAVVADLLKETTALYREVMTKRIELQSQMVAALAATMGGAAPNMPVVGV